MKSINFFQTNYDDFVKSLAELGQAPYSALCFIATTKDTKKHEEKKWKTVSEATHTRKELDV